MDYEHTSLSAAPTAWETQPTSSAVGECRQEIVRTPSHAQLELVTADPCSNDRQPVRLLFIHGLWHGAWCWQRNFFDYFLRRGFAVAAFSLRGHGQSPGRPHAARRPWNDYRIQDYLEDVHTILDRFADEPLAVIGHSMGGYLTQKALETRNVQIAVLLASLPPTGIFGATWRFAVRYPRQFCRTVAKLSLAPVVQNRGMVSDLLLSDHASQQVAQQLHRDLSPESFRVFLEAFWPWRIQPSRVQSRVAVVASDKDAFISQRAAEATATAYRTTAHIVSGGGHDMMLDAVWADTAGIIQRLVETSLQEA